MGNLGGLRNCKKCGRLFSDEGGVGMCSRCNEDADSQFIKVREYIYNNSHATIKVVSAETGVDSEIILKYIRDGKIVLGESSAISMCERCGKPADGDRYCIRCVNELSVGLKSGLSEAPKKKVLSMHSSEGRK